MGWYTEVWIGALDICSQRRMCLDKYRVGGYLVLKKKTFFHMVWWSFYSGNMRSTWSLERETRTLFVEWKGCFLKGLFYDVTWNEISLVSKWDFIDISFEKRKRDFFHQVWGSLFILAEFTHTRCGEISLERKGLPFTRCEDVILFWKSPNTKCEEVLLF